MVILGSPINVILREDLYNINDSRIVIRQLSHAGQMHLHPVLLYADLYRTTTRTIVNTVHSSNSGYRYTSTYVGYRTPGC